MNASTETAPVARRNIPADVDAALDRFMELVQALQVEYIKKFETLNPDQMSIDATGRKYLRIVRTTDNGKGQRSVYCFVEKATGDVYKSASWAAPAKHVRGNIKVLLDTTKTLKDCGVNAYGANYIR